MHNHREELPSLLGNLASEMLIMNRGKRLRSSFLLWPVFVTFGSISGSPVDAQEQHTLQMWNITGHSRGPLHSKRESQAKLYPEVKGKQDVVHNKNVFLHKNVLLSGYGWS